jgi:hypothetical protein
LTDSLVHQEPQTEALVVHIFYFLEAALFFSNVLQTVPASRSANSRARKGKSLSLLNPTAVAGSPPPPVVSRQRNETHLAENLVINVLENNVEEVGDWVAVGKAPDFGGIGIEEAVSDDV